jgi:4,5-dihydroxyphthalate decarboxylase
MSQPTRVQIAFKPRPRVKALQDGTVKLDGVDLVVRDDLGSSERHRLVLEGSLDAGEMSTSGFIRGIAEGRPLLALPVFIKRGFVHENLYRRNGSPIRSVRDLIGKRVGVPWYASTLSVWVRGLLQSEYGVAAADIHWFTPRRESIDRALEGIRLEYVKVPPSFSRAEVFAWEKLDGYRFPLTRDELYFLDLLEQGALDAVVFNFYRLESDTVTPLIAEEEEAPYFEKTGIYPIAHTVVIQRRVYEADPALPGKLWAGLKQARALESRYRSESARLEFEKEQDKLGGMDPFAYELGACERRTLTAYLRYLQEQRVMPRPLELDDLFVPGVENFPPAA